jgi:toxin ParE1/3/4
VSYRVTFRPRAETDLRNLYHYIGREAGLAAAGGYIDRIEAACMALADFPERGTPRNDIHSGLRTLGFERRALIVYEVRRRNVRIVRLLYGGQDFEGIFGG